MKNTKFILGVSMLIVATLGAFATAKVYTPTLVYYPVGIPNTTTENCIPHFTNIHCSTPGTGCVDDIENVGANIQLYQEVEEMEGTDRFRCIISLYDE